MCLMKGTLTFVNHWMPDS